MARRQANLFTIPAGIPFARALASGLVVRLGADPLTLSDALILVPTRRAVRTLRDAFAERLGGAALGPRIRPLGDLEDEESLSDPSTDELEARPAVTSLRRRLRLAQLVEGWAKAKGETIAFAQAASHAESLARFLDEALTQGADLTRLASLPPDGMAAHWREVARFLAIIGEEWPRLLDAEGATEEVTRRDTELRHLAARLAAKPPKGPVIAAGSTGSIPATAELLKAIAHLPQGAVVLPGLDTAMDAEAWNEIDAGHPQFGLKQLLLRLECLREDVEPWPAPVDDYATREPRVHFLGEALRPPPTTDAWRGLVTGGHALSAALDHVALVEAAHPREEALVIAIALREALETPGRTAALVTPDRNLARRVAAELTRWDIAIDDSAGRPLAHTAPGAFLTLLARASAEGFAPVPLLALLKHPLAAAGQERSTFLRQVRFLERRGLRGLPPAPGLAGVAAQLAKKQAPSALQEWWARLARMLEPLSHALQDAPARIGDLARLHAETAETFAAREDEHGAHALWRGPAGEAAARLMEDLQRDGADITIGRALHYAELFRDLCQGRAVRAPYNLHPRLAILGPLEARLQDFDLVILGGLNEGTWPAEAASDPWLSRPMRQQLGLEAPERRIGLAAHDFAIFAAARSVLLTRALKENGAPTVASRWLLRIRQLAKGLKLEAALASRTDLLLWARRIDDGETITRARRPAPSPPVAARPRALPITRIETWLRDPYAVYARHVLGLRPLDPLDAEPGPLERGNAMHQALEHFLRAYPDTLPDNALAELRRFGEEAFAEAGASGGVLALWRPRFDRAAQWFLAYEARRRATIRRSHTEIEGKLVLNAPGGDFTLHGRADRIDLHTDGSADILDYKTGRAPSNKQVETLLAPQLPLEAAMLVKGAFGDLRADAVKALIHVRLPGGSPPGEECVADVDATAKAAEALAKLQTLIARYDSPTQGYVSRAMPFLRSDVGDYDHLARVREWSLATEGEE